MPGMESFLSGMHRGSDYGMRDDEEFDESGTTKNSTKN